MIVRVLEISIGPDRGLEGLTKAEITIKSTITSTSLQKERGDRATYL